MGGSNGPEDKALSDLIMSYWVNFAETGNPNGPSLPAWPAFNEKDQKVIVFDKLSIAMPYPNLDKLKAFDEYYAKLREEAKAKK